MPNPGHPSTPRLDSHSSASVGSEYLYPLDVTVAIYLQPSLFEMLPCPLHVLESIYVGHALTGPNWRCGNACQLSVLPALMGRSVKDVLDHETDRERYDAGLDLTGASRQGRTPHLVGHWMGIFQVTSDCGCLGVGGRTEAVNVLIAISYSSAMPVSHMPSFTARACPGRLL